MFAAFGLVIGWARFRHHWKGRRPVSERLLRSPGESLASKLRDLDEALSVPLLALTLVCTALGFGTQWAMTSVGLPLRWYLLAAMWPLGVAAVVLASWRLVHVMRRRFDYHLGFMGERAVGEELNKLMLDGCLVFHDLPGERWNVDHVVINDLGVFAIETKARRKRSRGDAEDFRVTFDGQKLLFPDRWETDALDQARRNARWLSEFLSKAVGEKVPVEAILTFPGWFVDRKGKGDVSVLNPREIRKFILRSAPPVLSPEQIKRIAYQVEQKCRDVEF